MATQRLTLLYHNKRKIDTLIHNKRIVESIYLNGIRIWNNKSVPLITLEKSVVNLSKSNNWFDTNMVYTNVDFIVH